MSCSVFLTTSSKWQAGHWVTHEVVCFHPQPSQTAKTDSRQFQARAQSVFAWFTGAMCSWNHHFDWGKPVFSIIDEFPENFRMAFDPALALFFNKSFRSEIFSSPKKEMFVPNIKKNSKKNLDRKLPPPSDFCLSSSILEKTGFPEGLRPELAHSSGLQLVWLLVDVLHLVCPGRAGRRKLIISPFICVRVFEDPLLVCWGFMARLSSHFWLSNGIGWPASSNHTASAQHCARSLVSLLFSSVVVFYQQLNAGIFIPNLATRTSRILLPKIHAVSVPQPVTSGKQVIG